MDPATIMGVKRGMNKVRVSVGEHVSEPSEVFILTCASHGELSTFIVLFMVQPKVRIIYGYDGNPFSPSDSSQAESEAVEFVETMGSILEDLPWDEMSATERQAWMEGENLLGPAMEEILDASDIYEVEEVDEKEAVEEAPTVDEALLLEPVRESKQAEEEQAASKKEPEAGEQGDEDVHDVLGKVFLKPGLLASANRKVRFESPSEIEIDVEEPEREGEAEAPPGPEPPSGLGAKAPDQPQGWEHAGMAEEPATAMKGEEAPDIPVSVQKDLKRDTRMKVLRFLSRM